MPTRLDTSMKNQDFVEQILLLYLFLYSSDWQFVSRSVSFRTSILKVPHCTWRQRQQPFHSCLGMSWVNLAGNASVSTFSCYFLQLANHQQGHTHVEEYCPLRHSVNIQNPQFNYTSFAHSCKFSLWTTLWSVLMAGNLCSVLIKDKFVLSFDLRQLCA